MTAMLRDLHLAYPGRFVTDVKTSCDGLFENNPYVTAVDPREPGVKDIYCHYSAVHQSNQRPRHMIEAMHQDLGDALGLYVPCRAFKGDVYLSDDEKMHSPIGKPYWIVNAGWKPDFTAKGWSSARFQSVVDATPDLTWVQIGESHHVHPRLRGAIDRVGQTSIRDLVRLVAHCQGVLCGITGLMHLAAAVPTKDGKLRPCVVLAGGREPAHWEQYPGHRFLDRVGSLPCCRGGACWRTKVVPVAGCNDSICDRPVDDGTGQTIPECMKMISVDDVVRAIRSYVSPRP